MEGIRFLLRDMAPREQQMKRIKAKIRTDRGRMDKRAKGEKIPMDSKTYPGELFFFIRVNELLNGLGSKLAIDLAYMELVKPYAERGITQSIPPSTRSESKAEDSEHIDAELSTLLSSETKLLEDEEKIAGVQVCVVDSEGRVIANHSRGHMGGVHRSLTMTPEAAILGYSCTKAITATVAHIMIEEGYLSLDEPICERVWTAFCPTEEVPLELKELGMDQKWQWKRQVTLRHILTHTAGFSSAFPKGLSIKSMASCETCIEAFRYDPSHPEDTLLPDDEPGKTCTYHSMSFGWLCAGVLRGAYAVRHAGSDDITYEQVYNTILKSRLSDATLLSGFFPCGIKLDNSKPTLALTEADVSMSRMTQLNREKQSMGETLEDSEEALSERKRLEAVLGTFRGREFLLDPRIWNCEVILEANVPAAGGRFSAKGLAHFYHELGSGKILSKDHLAVCTSPSATESSLGALQGQTVMSSSPKDSNQQESSSFGLGYQLIKMKDGDTKSAFGHAGVGGSIGFHHKESGMSVAVMLNKADGDRDTATRLVRKISDHFDWE
jgi:CubicO group peptidase (beta-lactamase class C family)